MTDPFYRPPASVSQIGWDIPRCRFFPRCDRPGRWLVDGKPCCHQCYYWGHLDDLGRASHNQWSDNQWRRR